MEGKDRKAFRAVAARMNYLGQDRLDVQYGVKEICASMSRPTAMGRMKAKRLARFLA